MAIIDKFSVDNVVYDIRDSAAGLYTAPAYSNLATYSAGEYVTKDGKTYICLEDITTAESWTPAHWQEEPVGTKISELQNALDSITQIAYSDNILTEQWLEGGLDANGQDTTTATLQKTDFVDLKSGETTLYFIRTSVDPLYSLNICFYSTKNTNSFISRSTIFKNSGAGSDALKNSISIPATATYFRLSVTKNRSGNICVSYTNINAYVPYSETVVLKDAIVSEDKLDAALKTKINSLHLPFYGKTIAFFGDSVVGNFNDTTGLCSIIAAKTGATVINCAFGGTRMAYRYYDEETPASTAQQYQYWNALSGYGLAQAIATDTWTDQDTAVANLTSPPSYFSDRLTALKAVDFDDVDYILWEYGTNDFSTEVMLSDTEDTTNLFAFDNAYRGAIEAISTAYPNVQIIPITPTWRFWEDDGTYLYDSNTHTMDDYEGTARLLTAFIEEIKDIAKEYQLPCIDDYYTLGANRFTKSAFFDATDGVHPNANGREKIAEHIASQLDSVV